MNHEKSVKIFLNKWEHATDNFWHQVAKKLEEKGFEIHKESSDCDVAILLNATFLNPSAYKNKVGFYLGTKPEVTGNKVYWLDLMSPILEKYYKPGRLINIIGNTVDQTANRVEFVYRQLHDNS